MRMYRFILLLLIPMSMLAQDQREKLIVGSWLTANGDAHIRMEQVNGKVQGKLSWVREPNHPDGKPKLDDKNPDKDKRNRPLLGLYLLKGFTYSGEGKWEGGTVYDPELGKVYNCILTLNGNDKLEVRGYIGFAAIGRTETWTRVKGN